MAVSLKSLGIDSLDLEERLTLVEAISLTPAQRDELDRRIAEHEVSPDDVVPWEEVKASVTERLKK